MKILEHLIMETGKIIIQGSCHHQIQVNVLQLSVSYSLILSVILFRIHAVIVSFLWKPDAFFVINGKNLNLWYFFSFRYINNTAKTLYFVAMDL